MADKVIAAQLQVDTDQAQRNVLKLTNEIAEYKKQVKDANKGSEEEFEAFKKLKSAQEELIKTQKSLNTTTQETTSHFENIKGSLTKMHPAFSEAGDKVEGLSSKLKLLLANPVVLTLTAIVGVLALLYKAFTNTFAGAEKVEQIFAGIKSAAQVLTDRVLDLGGAITKFFSGDFTGAMHDAKKAVTGVGDAVAQVYGRTAELTKKLQEIKKEELQDEIEKSERGKRLALLREQLNDDTISVKKKMALAKELREDEEKNAKDDLDRAKRKAAVQIELLQQGKDGALKNREEIAKIQIEINNTEKENALEGVRTNKVIRNLEKQQDAEGKEAYKKMLEEKKEALRKAKEAEKKIIEDANRANADAEKVLEKGLDRAGELELLKKEYAAKEALAIKANQSAFLIRKAYLFERNALEDKFRKEDEDKEKEIKKRKEDFMSDLAKNQLARIDDFARKNKQAADEQNQIDNYVMENKVRTFDMITQATNALADLVGKQTIAGKALGIATALINTYQGATEALKQKSTLPSPFDVIAKVAAVATVVASGLSAVRAITSVQVPGGGGGGGSVPSVSVAAPAPITPQQQTTTINQAQVNQMGNATVRAFVIDTDVQNNRERNERLNRQARLGG